LQNVWIMFDHVKCVVGWKLWLVMRTILPIAKWWPLQYLTCSLRTSKINKSCGQSLMRQSKAWVFQNQIWKDSWLITQKPIITLSELFMGLGTPLSWWLIRSTHVYSIGFNHLIGTPNNSSNLSCKINTMLLATSTRMQNPLWRLTISMLQFVVVGCHQGLLLR
jgi:hypothetical protein